MNDQIGIFPGVAFEEYAKIDALNGSTLVNMRRSPMYYRHCLDHPQPPTPAMILGTATHRLILEPNKIGDFAVWGTLEEEKVRRGKVWENFQALNQGAMIVTVNERDAMVGMAAGARKNLPIMKYANMDGDTEVCMVWTDKASGRLFKGRLDKIIPVHSIIVDLKTTRDCHPFRFASQAYALAYHIKAYIYVSGFQTLTAQRPKFKWLAIDSKAPHESAVYRATPDVLSQGATDLDEILKTLDVCEKTGLWPAAEQEETDLILPAYALTDVGESLEEFAVETEEA